MRPNGNPALEPAAAVPSGATPAVSCRFLRTRMLSFALRLDSPGESVLIHPVLDRGRGNADTGPRPFPERGIARALSSSQGSRATVQRLRFRKGPARWTTDSLLCCVAYR